ncbi:sensor domain-containing diguanylate cyclase [Actinoplanes aureus]|uniref:Diguanylate cyclase n=1 Tax=Actinoplanes aureus TaxID=2792083 RepID=A0A931G2E3_9ACTN|nr:sensor domain-containing diguanylate cyclase [Actinoplanes aureus]MBG0566056.1 diguanylate cyclase [Actinoplanes aureus]
MVRHSLRKGSTRIRSFVQRDLMRSLRLFFLVSLPICSVGLTVQVWHMGVGVAATVGCAAAQLFLFTLRAVEFSRARPLPIWVDAVELAAAFFVFSQVTDVSPMINTMFMCVLFRAAIGTLPRLLLSQAGYLGIWAIAVALPWHVKPVVGAMISLPITTLMVYGTRTLMTKLQEQQKAQNALLEGVLTELPFPVVVTDAAGDVVLANPAVTELIGWQGAGAPDLGELEMQDLEGLPINLRTVAAGAGRTKQEVRLVRADGSTLQVVVQTVPMATGLTQDRSVVLALLDVTAQRSYEEHLHKAAYFDLLTGLPNRRMLFERLTLAHSSGMPYAMLLIDLNDFKVVNDTLGHAIGDELLAGVAERIRSAVDETATVARLGGDEFAVLLPHADPAAAEVAAQAVRDSFTEPLLLSCGPLQGKGTVGLSVAESGDTPDGVLEKADAAMYLAKPSGKRRTRSPQSPRNALAG